MWWQGLGVLLVEHCAKFMIDPGHCDEVQGLRNGPGGGNCCWCRCRAEAVRWHLPHLGLTAFDWLIVKYWATLAYTQFVWGNLDYVIASTNIDILILTFCLKILWYDFWSISPSLTANEQKLVYVGVNLGQWGNREGGVGGQCCRSGKILMEAEG